MTYWHSIKAFHTHEVFTFTEL